jgi:hypothetical protein
VGKKKFDVVLLYFLYPVHLIIVNKNLTKRSAMHEKIISFKDMALMAISHMIQLIIFCFNPLYLDIFKGTQNKRKYTKHL